MESVVNESRAREWMTSMLHTGTDRFDRELQLSQLRYVMKSRSAAASLAENYAGLPI